MEFTRMKNKKILLNVTGVICAISFLAVFLITSIEAVCYWIPGYFETEYTKYDVLDDLPEMTMEDLLDVTDQMMAYLRGDREDLHIYTTMGGEYREFFTEREISHMDDVQKLFIAGLVLRNICLVLIVVCAAAAWILTKDDKDILPAYPRSMCVGTGALFAVVAVIAGICSTDFDRYFVIFHHIFFDNDLWLLDPRVDMLVNIVPEEFFMDTALYIVIIFAVLVIVFFAVNIWLWRHWKKKASKS